MRKLILNFHAGVKRWIKDFMEIKKSPIEIAIGFSIGLLIGILLTPGLNIIIALALIAFLRINKLATMSAMLLASNPFLIPFVLILSFKTGSLITGDKLLEGINIFQVKALNPSIIQQYLNTIIIGNILLAVTFSILGFIIIYLFFTFYYRIKKIDINKLP